MRLNLTRLAFLPLCAAPATAQQLQQVTAFPGTAFWSEGVECADADQDGDLDVFVADGDGFATAGTQRQSRLYMNQHAQGTSWSLVDESVARFGAHVSNAKCVTTGDLTGDGWVDALYSNAFSTQLPYLYINRGAAQPGYFNFEGQARGFTTLLSSGSAAFGDVDDDGDLDVIINDAYNTGAATTRRARLYRNDGVGNFTQDAAFLPPLKSGQMDVQFADIDNDWDLDFFGPNKGTAAGSTHYLMTNDGAGAYTDRSNLITSASGNTYEAEPGDLDGDNDLDLFFVSLTGFAEGSLRNNLNTGALGFTQIQTIGANDDNEIAYFDYDCDGDYDVFVGSLGATEAVYNNNGAGTMTAVTGTVIQAQADSTLDLAVADLNNDGRYDLVSVQGESGVFTNKFYRNVSGALDTRAPLVTGVLAPTAATGSGPWICKAKVRDQVLDDGINYVRGYCEWIEVNAATHALAAIVTGGSVSLPSSVAAGTMLTLTNGDAASFVLQVSGPRAYTATIASGASSVVGFVVPGVYTLTTSSGATATLTVNAGSFSSAEGLNQNGQMYRFAVTRQVGGTGDAIARQLRFVDWAGNTTMVALPTLLLPSTATGTPFCFGDGSGTACPCGNASAVGAQEGCLNSLATAGRLRGTGVASIAADTFVLQGTGMANSSALYFQGTTQANTGLGTAFGDGLRCAGGTVVRLGTKTNAAGVSSFPGTADGSVSVRGGVPAGATRTYQVWYRNAAAFCAAETFNLTNGLSVVWTP